MGTGGDILGSREKEKWVFIYIFIVFGWCVAFVDLFDWKFQHRLAKFLWFQVSVKNPVEPPAWGERSLRGNIPSNSCTGTADANGKWCTCRLKTIRTLSSSLTFNEPKTWSQTRLAYWVEPISQAVWLIYSSSGLVRSIYASHTNVLNYSLILTYLFEWPCKKPVQFDKCMWFIYCTKFSLVY